MNWFRSLSRAKQIASFVLAAHLLLLLVLLGDYWVTRNPLRTKKIIVKNIRYPTLQPHTKTPAAVAAETKPARQKTTTQDPPKSPPSKKKQNSSPSKQGPRKTTLTETKPATLKQKQEKVELLDEIAKNLDTIAIVDPRAASKPKIDIPTFNPILHFAAESSDIDTSDGEKIAILLQELLQLPEYGEVKVELKIDRAGRLESCTILESRSAKNEQFLKKALPEVQFPCLNEAASYTIVFRNAT